MVNRSPQITQHRLAHAAFYPLALEKRSLSIFLKDAINAAVACVGRWRSVIAHSIEQAADQMLKLLGIYSAQIFSLPNLCAPFSVLSLTLRLLSFALLVGSCALV